MRLSSSLDALRAALTRPLTARILAGAVAATLLSGVPAVAEERVVNVFSWSDYIDPTVLEQFTKETGIKVVYDTMDSNEVLETKLLAGNTGYDVVVPSATFLSRQIKAGVYQPLDKAKLPNLKNMWPEVMKNLEAYDPGNQYATDYMWFATGIGYNADKIKQRLGDIPLNSWDLVFKPEVAAKIADCGIYVLDSPEDIFAAALTYMGRDANSKKPEDIQAAGEIVAKVRPYIKKFHSSEYINALANGDICLAIGWAGDVFQAQARAQEAKNKVDVEFVIPREGSLMNIDTLAVPKDAPHLAEAYAYIDFMMRPEIAAKNVAATRYASGVLAAKPLVDKEILANPGIYPDDATFKRLFTVTTPDAKQQRVVTRVWQRLQTGQ